MFSQRWTASIALLASVARSQTVQGAFDTNLLCNGSFSDANATGVFSYNPEVDQGPQAAQADNNSGKTLPVDLAVTVTEDRNTSKLSITSWINPRGADYSDDFGLGYDVCGMVWGGLFPNNTNSRGANDNGSCYDTFDRDCVEAVKTQAQQFALDLTKTPSPGPNSNLTVDSIFGVCNDIATMLSNNIPSQCMKYLGTDTATDLPFALTGYNSSGIYGSVSTGRNCVTNPSYNDTYYRVITDTADFSEDRYSYFANAISPVLLIWMPIANADRPSTILYSTAGMICTHVNHVNPGSETPAPFPSPTPVGGSSSLSGGAIAGIVVGALAGVGLVAGAVAWWFLSKRRKAKKASATTKSAETLDEKINRAPGGVGDINKEPTSATTAPDAVVSELHPDSFRPELEGGKETQQFEMAAGSEAKELVGEQNHVVELEGSAPAPKELE